MEIIISALIGGFFGGGLRFVMYIMNRKSSAKAILNEIKEMQKKQMEDAENIKRLALATAQLTITTIGDRYIRKYKNGTIKGVTNKELSILEDQYQPYKDMGANHWAELTMKEVRKLPRI